MKEDDDHQIYEECCDVSQGDLAFIRRTQQLIRQYDTLVNRESDKAHKKRSYSRTLFVNCCMGLLFIPYKHVYKDELLNSRAKDWGINTSDYKRAEGDYENILMSELLRHLRNSLAHQRFECKYNKRKEMTAIFFEDRAEEKGPLTFSGQMPYKDFKTLVTLLSAYTMDKGRPV